jgi:hypothetical protein
MPRALLAAAFALALMGCRSGSARLEGTWKGQRAEGVTVDSQIAANAFAREMVLEVKGDSITVTTAKDKQTGKYKVVKEDKSSLVIVTDKDGDADQQTFTFVDDKTMKWAVLEGKTITFSKQ